MLKENRSLLQCIRIAATSQLDKLIGCELVFLKAASQAWRTNSGGKLCKLRCPGKVRCVWRSARNETSSLNCVLQTYGEELSIRWHPPAIFLE